MDIASYQDLGYSEGLFPLHIPSLDKIQSSQLYIEALLWCQQGKHNHVLMWVHGLLKWGEGGHLFSSLYHVFIGHQSCQACFVGKKERKECTI